MREALKGDSIQSQTAVGGPASSLNLSNLYESLNQDCVVGFFVFFFCFVFFPLNFFGRMFIPKLALHTSTPSHLSREI